MSKPGMSIHSIESFNESEEINLLSSVLEAKHTIKTFFSANDRTPNHDGFFELVSSDLSPKKQFIVQIKKVEDLKPNTIGPNKGKYSYELKTNFLYYVKEKVTESPAIYFVVDIVTKRIFWLYLSDAVLMDLNFEGHLKVSYAFGEANVLSDVDVFTTKLNKYRFKGKYVYRCEGKARESGQLAYVSSTVHVYPESAFQVFRDDGIEDDFTEATKNKGIERIISGLIFDEFLAGKSLYYDSICCLLYEGVCRELGYKPERLSIQKSSFLSGLLLFD